MKSTRYMERDEPLCAICNHKIGRRQFIRSVGPKIAHVHCHAKRTKRKHYQNNPKEVGNRGKRKDKLRRLTEERERERIYEYIPFYYLAIPKSSGTYTPEYPTSIVHNIGGGYVAPQKRKT